MTSLVELVNRIKSGESITKEESAILLKENLDELLKQADEIRAHFCGERFDFYSIVDGKTKRDSIFMDAIHHACKGIREYCIVTDGKKFSQEDVEEVCKMYRQLDDDLTLNLGASHGVLDAEKLGLLKEAGIKGYYHNLEASRGIIGDIHTYEESIRTIKAAKEVGLEVDSGAIFGMGESMEARIDMAFELRELDVNSISVGMVNFGNGVLLEDCNKLTEDEFLRVVAIFRFINPTKVIRLTGDRSQLEAYGIRSFKGGINGAITGGLLTTCGYSIERDFEVVRELGFVID